MTRVLIPWGNPSGAYVVPEGFGPFASKAVIAKGLSKPIHLSNESAPRQGVTMSTKFKVGDQVNMIVGTAVYKGAVNPCTVVTIDDGEFINFKDASGCYFYGASTSRFALATPAPKLATKHWFICRLSEGLPVPALRPRVYTSEAQASAVALKMAEENRGDTFAVYAMTEAVKAPVLVPAIPPTERQKL